MVKKHNAIFAIVMLSIFSTGYSAIAPSMAGLMLSSIVGDSTTVTSETLWVFAATRYIKGGIRIPYLPSQYIHGAPYCVATPLLEDNFPLKQITPLIKKSTTELIIVVSVTDENGTIREAETNEVTLDIFVVFPNYNQFDIPYIGIGSQ